MDSIKHNTPSPKGVVFIHKVIKGGKTVYEEPVIVCFSYLRWNESFQRPQQLLSRLSLDRKVYFIERPLFDEKHSNMLHVDRKNDNLFIVVPHLQENTDSTSVDIILQTLLKKFFQQVLPERYNFWYYSSSALRYTKKFTPNAVIFDCLDEHLYLPSDTSEDFYKKADLIFTADKNEFEKKQNIYSNIHYMPNSPDNTNPYDQSIFWDQTSDIMKKLVRFASHHIKRITV